MKIFAINNEINRIFSNAIDPETGAFVDDSVLDQLVALQMEKEEKTENLLIAYKNEMALVDALNAEIENLSARLNVHKNKAAGIKSYAEMILDGATFESAKVKVSYRNSESVEVPKGFDWEPLKDEAFVVTKTTYTPDKVMLKKLLKEGKTFEFAELVRKRNIQIK